MFKIFFLVVSLLALKFLFPTTISAHCPLCVGGAAIGLSVARFLGIDDAITGLWLAALLGAASFWLDGYLVKKIKINKDILRPALYIILFALTIWSFYALNDYVISNFRFYLINKHVGNIFGVDKLPFGMIVGGAAFYLVDILDNLIIKRNGKVLFPYQRVVVSLGSILILSLAVYLLLNYYL